MRKTIVFLTMLLLAAPVMAATTITCVDEGSGVLRIDYDASTETEVRAFGLDVEVDASCTITAVISVNSNYYIYPGTIQITDGNVTSWGSPVAPANDPGAKSGLGTGAVTLELGSLYAAGDGNLTPALSGTLCSLQVNSNGTVDCNVTVTANITRGGVVNINAETVVVGTSNCSMTDVPSGECYAGMIDYQVWSDVNKPDCWCTQRQCHGDATNSQEGSGLEGYWYVGTPDIQVVAAAWKIKETPQGPGIATISFNGIPGACADFSHSREGSGLEGYWHVGTPDIQIIATYWKIKESPQGPGVPPDCQPGNVPPLN